MNTVVPDGAVPIRVRVGDESRNCRLNHPVLLSIFIFQSLLFGYSMSHSIPRPISDPFNAQNESSCSAASVSDDPWSCDLSRADFLLRRGRSCHSPDQFVSLSRAAPAPQCLVLSSSSATDLCRTEPASRRLSLSHQLTLTFCHKYSLNMLLRQDDWHRRDSKDCTSFLKPLIHKLLKRDEIASSLSCEFDALLSRYNCHTDYSVKWDCPECSRTYKDWICSTALQYFQNGQLRKPCRSLCERVEQRCPYFHPWYKDQYAGEPAFICIDPMIPFIPALTPVIPYGDADSCYDVCDLEQSRNNNNCSNGNSFSDCSDLQRSSTASHQDRLTEQNLMTMNTTTTTTTRKQFPNIPLLDQQQQEDDADDEVADFSTDPQADEEVDDELENSSSLTTETVVRLKESEGGRDKS